MARNAYARVRRPGQLVRAGQTPFDVIAVEGIARLRYYPPDPGTGSPGLPPLVIVPPLAVNMLIYDLFPERSLVRYFRDRGFPLYLIDWGRPTRRHARYRFATYLRELMPALLEAVRAHGGRRRLALHGWSLGAMMCYAYAALGDAEVDKLVLLGPPCDYHAPGRGTWQNRFLGSRLKAIEAATGWGVHGSPQALWHVPGWFNSLAFKTMSPTGTLRGYTELLRRLDDDDFVAAHATQGAFIDDMVAYPGGVTQDILQFLIADNVLALGRLPIADCDASLADVRAKVMVVVGDRDPIITPAASRRLLDLMPAAASELIEVPGGHMSIVSGSQAPELIWPRVADWLAAG